MGWHVATVRGAAEEGRGQGKDCHKVSVPPPSNLLCTVPSCQTQWEVSESGSLGERHREEEEWQIISKGGAVVFILGEESQDKASQR